MFFLVTVHHKAPTEVGALVAGRSGRRWNVLCSMLTNEYVPHAPQRTPLEYL